MSVDRVLRAGLLSLLMVSSASAQTPIQVQPDAGQAAAPVSAPPDVVDGNPLATRPQVASVLRFLQAQGVKLTTLGTEGGLAGYLGESPNSRMQVFYVTPDGSHVIAGLMFDSQGANVTGVQLGEMQRRFESAQKQLSPSAPASSATQPPAAAPGQKATEVVPPSIPALPQKLAAGSLSDAAGVPQPSVLPPAVPPSQPAAPSPEIASGRNPAVQQPSPAPSASAGAASVSSSAADKYVSGFDRGAVERALREVPWFQVGVKEAPALYVVVDPQCPFCHAAWQRLQPYVYAKKLQLRIIMIAGLKGSMPQAISILSRQNPGEAWLAGEGSLDNFTVQPAPAPDSQQYQSAQKYIDMNAAFVRTFGISSTPTFMYFGKDERLYSSIGLPEDADAFMAALK